MGYIPAYFRVVALPKDLIVWRFNVKAALVSTERYESEEQRLFEL